MFIALGIQHAIRMRQIVTCGLPTLKYFSTLSHKPHYSGKSGVEHKTVLRFSSRIWSEIFLILRRIERDVIKMCWVLIERDMIKMCWVLIERDVIKMCWVLIERDVIKMCWVLIERDVIKICWVLIERDVIKICLGLH